MILGPILFLLTAGFWLEKSYRKWPRLFGLGDFFFAAGLGSIAGMAGFIFEIAWRTTL